MMHRSDRAPTGTRSFARVWQVWRDLVNDVLVEMSARRARSIMIMAAVALSTGALICAVGISVTAARQVDAGLAAGVVDTFTVRGTLSNSSPGQDQATFTTDAEERLYAIPGVVAAGRYLELGGTIEGAIGRAFDTNKRDISNYQVIGVKSGYFDAVRAQPTSASLFLMDAPERVVVLGSDIADELDIPVTADPTGLAVILDGQRYEVLGFVSAGTTDLSRMVLIPYHVAEQLAGNDSEAVMYVRTQVGAGPAVARVATTALRPEAPQHLRASTVIDASKARTGVSTQLDRLAAGVGALLLLLSILLIANSMIVAVMSRTPEIGLRRAIGSSARYVAMLFLLEGSIAGLLGGLAGTALGTVALVVVSLVNEWSFVMPLPVLLGGPVIGALTGVLSSAYPAFRAAGIAPAIAVRAD